MLLTFNVLGRAKTDRLMALAARLRRLAVVLDNEVVARELSEAGARHGADVRFLIECDTGFGRNGVQTPEAALDLARVALKLPRLAFEGLMTFPNRDPGTREFFTRALELFKRAGIPVPVVSGGGTPSLFRAQEIPMLTEHRAGTYIFNDAMVVASGTATKGRHRRRHEGADVGSIHGQGLRPRPRISGGGRHEPLRGARHRGPLRVPHAAGRR